MSGRSSSSLRTVSSCWGWPLPESPVSGGSYPPASGLLRLCPPGHLRIARIGAQGQRTRDKAANLSTATAQDQLRGLLWEDLVTYLKEQRHEKSVLAELERLRVA